MSNQFVNGQWDDIIIYSTGLGAGSGTPGQTTFIGNIVVKTLSTGDGLYGSFEIPHDYKQGSNLNAHVHWFPSTGDTGIASFQFEYSIANVNSVFPAGSTLLCLCPASGATFQHQLAGLTAPIVGTSIAIGAIMQFHLQRNATADTFTGLAALTSVGVHYQKDSHGSNQITSKN